MPKKVDDNPMNKYQRYAARKRGEDIPKQLPGPKPKPFWSLIRRTDGCWFWLGRTNRDGYGVYSVNGGCRLAHRLMWVEQGNFIPEGKILLHKCDMPRCVNPCHLFVGTHQDNQADKTRKGRQAKGSGSGSAKLSEFQVREIRFRYRPHRVTYKALANEFGVCVDTVRKVVQGINWRHVA